MNGWKGTRSTLRLAAAVGTSVAFARPSPLAVRWVERESTNGIRNVDERHVDRQLTVYLREDYLFVAPEMDAAG